MSAVGGPPPVIVWLEHTGIDDIANVGGKNASLGEMIQHLHAAGIRVPPGFATTAQMYRDYVQANGLNGIISQSIDDYRHGRKTLTQAGEAIRSAFLQHDFPAASAQAILDAYATLNERAQLTDLDVAVRSSATAEDLPTASFAGQQETMLNIRGGAALLAACRRCYASLFTDRAISYREIQRIDHEGVALSIGVQQMVRADRGSAGVMFTLDTESGFDRIVLINAAWGLGEGVVQGIVDPDEYQVFKPLLLADKTLRPIIEKRCGAKHTKLIYRDGEGSSTQWVPTSKLEREKYVLSDAEVLQLSRWACAIEAHYGRPMDIEWARDGLSGELFILQSRPETVESRRSLHVLNQYSISNAGAKLASGISIGNAAVAAEVCLIENPNDIHHFKDGAVLVTSTTDPDWVPIMKRAAAIITDHGGRTSHAAIVSRELGLPAVVGTGNATQVLHDLQVVTVSCAEGEMGNIYEGRAHIVKEEIDLKSIPRTKTQVMLNLANPAAALRWWRLPADGVGLARMEFVIGTQIRIHPMALVRYASLRDSAAQSVIEQMTRQWQDKTAFFVDTLARALGHIAATVHPKPVIVRLSDFKTNEYANLIGGREFEPDEQNPMLGFRGAARYHSERYRDGFALECRAIRQAREELGFRNIVVMIPFCRSLEEADLVLKVMAEHGLSRGRDSLQIFVMCEIPSNVILASKFAARFDGFSIGSNDLTQLTLGVDRDSAELAHLFDERDEAVQWMIEHLIEEAHRCHVKVGLCGQAPSDHPQFAQFLVRSGIDSISVSPDSFVAVKQHVAAAEAALESKAQREARRADTSGA